MRERAEQIALSSRLRTADALQLAGAGWARSSLNVDTFVSFDDGLGEAALDLGFRVETRLASDSLL